MVLQCGAFTVLYENGFLRHLRHGESEILRMIYFALRDENWGTFALSISNEKVVNEKKSFLIEYDAENKKGNETFFSWRVKIEGDEDGEITMTISGQAKRTFRKNRAGFCVLHPVRQIFNEPVQITHPDGSVTNHTFPQYVAAENPFQEISSMQWKFEDRWYELQFEGDIFETEDQRNWTDASFKTFCTPLRIPFPAEMQKGDTVSQRVRFKPKSQLTFKEPAQQITISLTQGDTHKPLLPEIGICLSPGYKLNENAIKRIRELPISHLRVDVFFSRENWKSDLEENLSILVKTGSDLELALHLTADFKKEINALNALLVETGSLPKQVMLFSQDKLATSQEHLKAAEMIKSKFDSTRTGAGTDYNFTELNRNRFKPEAIDFVTFAIDPQEHATDNLTIIENLEGQVDTARSALHVYNLPVHVSPVTLKRRFNPYATDPTQHVIPEEDQKDPRQTTAFCAVWTLGSIKSLWEANVESLTIHQVVGPLGILSKEGHALPVYEALDQILSLKNFVIKPSKSSSPRKVDALWLDGGKMILWNYTPDEQEVQIASRSETIKLKPFGVATFQ